MDNIANLTDSEKEILDNTKKFQSLQDKTDFEYYKSLRGLLLDKHLPLKASTVPKEDIKEIEEQIDFIKSLGFIHPKYIDNIIIYMEVLKSPLLSDKYLMNILDSSIKPKKGSDGIKPLHLLTIGYMSYKLSLLDNVSARMVQKVMEKHYGYNFSEIERAHYKCKQAYNAIGNNKEIPFFLDFIAFFLLWQDDFELERIEKKLGNNHQTQKSFVNLTEGFQVYCNKVAGHYIFQNIDFFVKSLGFSENLMTKECQRKIADQIDNKIVQFKVDDVTAILLSLIFYKIMPNIPLDTYLLDEMGIVPKEQ